VIQAVLDVDWLQQCLHPDAPRRVPLTLVVHPPEQEVAEISDLPPVWEGQVVARAHAVHAEVGGPRRRSGDLLDASPPAS
jgi:hypothetical protein